MSWGKTLSFIAVMGKHIVGFKQRSRWDRIFSIALSTAAMCDRAPQAIAIAIGVNCDRKRHLDPIAAAIRKKRQIPEIPWLQRKYFVMLRCPKKYC